MYMTPNRKNLLLTNVIKIYTQTKIENNECRNETDKKNWNNRTKKISWLRKSFPGNYDKDRVINNISIFSFRQ